MLWPSHGQGPRNPEMQKFRNSEIQKFNAGALAGAVADPGPAKSTALNF
jgi:hypothetical protein